jgi:hypothetical protein
LILLTEGWKTGKCIVVTFSNHGLSINLVDEVFELMLNGGAIVKQNSLGSLGGCSIRR